MTKHKTDGIAGRTGRLCPGPTRRDVLAGLAAAGSLAVPGVARAQSFKGKTIVFASWGGAYQDAERACYCEPFSRRTGAIVDQDGPIEYAKFRTMVAGGHPIWNVADVTIDFLYSGITSKLFEKIDRSKIHLDRIDPKYVNDYGIGCIVWSYNIGFNTKMLGPGRRPGSWADVWDVKAFPGMRSLRDRVAPMLEVALLADSVAPEDLYTTLKTEQGIRRAFSMLDRIRHNSLFWATNSQSQEFLADGEASCGIILNGRVYDAANKGAPIGLDWNQNIQSIDYLVILRGSSDIDVSLGLINEMTVAANQAKLANMIAYSPTNPAAFAGIDPKIAPWLATKPENAAKGFVLDAQFWEPRLQELSERWEQWKLS